MKPLQGNLDFFLIRASRGRFRMKHKTQGPMGGEGGGRGDRDGEHMQIHSFQCMTKPTTIKKKGKKKT